MLECVLSSYLVAVRVALHRMNLERAHTLLERAENQGHARGWGRLTAVALLERLRLCLKEGRTEEAAEYSARLERLAVAYPAPTNCSWSDISRYATWARACILSDHDRSDEAISILNGLRLELREVHNLQFALRVETDLSIMQFKSGRAGEALECFESLIKLLARAGIYCTILDEGAEVGPLIQALQKKWEKLSGADVAANYLSNLRAAWGSHHQSERPPTPISPIADALSTREGDILKLIADGLSNKEIARNLSIAPETVKSHVKHIFTKLNVEKRAQAVSRAQTLGLVGTPR
jgi:LuxR family transcriptional regulator, maltose regulon positive regulatory protein